MNENPYSPPNHIETQTGNSPSEPIRDWPFLVLFGTCTWLTYAAMLGIEFNLGNENLSNLQRRAFIYPAALVALVVAAGSTFVVFTWLQFRRIISSRSIAMAKFPLNLIISLLSTVAFYFFFQSLVSENPSDSDFALFTIFAVVFYGVISEVAIQASPKN